MSGCFDNDKFANINVTNGYIKNGDKFYKETLPESVEDPSLIMLNKQLCLDLEIDFKKLNSQQGSEFFSGNYILKNSTPIALAYAGHQFGNFVPSLGDGRAVLLGEITDKNNILKDIQLKGSGKTVFSRRGDGRSALGPVIREYIISEAMYLLGIKTTRSLAFVTTGQNVQRETMLPGGIITRVASSHIRIGSFEYFAAKGDIESVKKLSDYTINRHFPDFKGSDDQYSMLLKEVLKLQAELIASWMSVGFIHGVMNTDNSLIIGETIDYGPCAFMDEYDPKAVFSSIDRNSRYAYANQPYIAKWNVARFAQAILPLLAEDIQDAVNIAEDIIDQFESIYEENWLKLFCKKIGILNYRTSDKDLIANLHSIMHKNKLDFTNTYSSLPKLLENKDYLFGGLFEGWVVKWKDRLSEETDTKNVVKIMQNINPRYIPRNHLVEKAINQAVDENDFTFMKKFIKILDNPYDYNNENEEFVSLPTEQERVTQTFCGT